jgi:hypothetical protein
MIFKHFNYNVMMTFCLEVASSLNIYGVTILVKMNFNHLLVPQTKIYTNTRQLSTLPQIKEGWHSGVNILAQNKW